jgi:hypothetical protein
VQARWDSVETAIGSTCIIGHDERGREVWCPGYDTPKTDERAAHKCAPPDFPIVDRDTFPMCPRAMMMSPAWCEVRDIATLSETCATPARSLTYAGARALIELRRAYYDRQHEEAEAAKRKNQDGGSGQGPTFNGQRSTGK